VAMRKQWVSSAGLMTCRSWFFCVLHSNAACAGRRWSTEQLGEQRLSNLLALACSLLTGFSSSATARKRSLSSCSKGGPRDRQAAFTLILR